MYLIVPYPLIFSLKSSDGFCPIILVRNIVITIKAEP